MSTPIRVLFDVSVLGLSVMYQSARTGVFRVTEQLVGRLARREDIVLSFCSIHGTTHQAPDLAAACRHYLAQDPALAGVPFFEGEVPETDIYHSPFHALSDRVRTRARFLHVHDLIAVKFPQFFTPEQVRESHKLVESFRPEDFFFSVSESTKRDLVSDCGIDPGRVFVTPLAASEELFHPCRGGEEERALRAKYRLGERPYILSICTLEPRKNLEQVVRCFARLAATGERPDLLLVLAGTTGWLADSLAQALGDHKEALDRIVLTGYVPDRELAPLYSGARAFVYLSHYEGFGLPPLEAMRCGTPVLASNTSSIPEVVGDAGILLDPRDGDGVVRAMLEITGNDTLRRALAMTALKQSALFSWERTVEKVVQGYRTALAQAHDVTPQGQGSHTPSAGTPQPARREKKPVIVIDGVYFMMANTGIARVWKALLSAWAATPFGDCLVVLDRIRTAPRIPGLRYRIAPGYDCTPDHWDRQLLQTICDEEGADLFVSTYHSSPLTTPSLFLAHDMIPEMTGYYNLADPQWQEKRNALQRAAGVVAVSQSTANDLVRLYPALDGRVTVAHCGIDHTLFRAATESEKAQFRAHYGVNTPFFLYVGKLTENKNGELLLRAFARLADRECALVWVGGPGQLDPEQRRLLAGREVHLLKMSDTGLRIAYSAAEAFAYPSTYEGFGLPILEAMACGCPVITCRNSSLPEVAGEAALYVDPNDPEELAAAMLKVRNPADRARLVSLGLAQAAGFSWQRMAEAMREAMLETIGRATR